MTARAKRDHGGGLDAAAAAYGGSRDSWIDLSTGINPEPYPTGIISQDAWTALPDQAAVDRLLTAARRFWNVPEAADIIAAPGASSLIASLPLLAPNGPISIPGPTYNEHAAAFRFHGAEVVEEPSKAVQVWVHPNNPDGRLKPKAEPEPALTIIDESFCDVMPEASLIALTSEPGTIILKSFGKFWGLAGLRLGFAIGHPDTLAGLSDHLGPWAVAGPALEIGAQALNDEVWAAETRVRLAKDSDRLDALMRLAGAQEVCGTTLFRTYTVANAREMQDRLARHHIWSRIFPYSETWIRLGLPPTAAWDRLEKALAA